MADFVSLTCSIKSPPWFDLQIPTIVRERKESIVNSVYYNSYFIFYYNTIIGVKNNPQQLTNQGIA